MSGIRNGGDEVRGGGIEREEMKDKFDDSRNT